MEPEQALEKARAGGATYADVRVETVEENRLSIMDGELRGLVSGTETGFALRVLVKGAWGFASSNDLEAASWRDALERALALARAAAVHVTEPVRLADAPTLRKTVDWKAKRDPRGIAVEEKVELLRRMDEAVRRSPEIRNVTTAYTDATVSKRFLSSEGTQLQWSLVRSVAQAHFTAKKDGQLAGRSTRVGGTKGWELFADEDPVSKAMTAAESTVRALGASAAKGGRRTVVIDPELAGVFAHEAVGHASEADLVAAGESCFKGRIGKRLGIAGLSIRDDSTVPGAFGSFPFDDNGVAGASKPILEDGVLVGYLADRQHAAGLGVQPNGAARAQDFHSRPLVRMSNTLIEAGDRPEDEVFAGIKDGVFCKGSRGGQVDTARGTFLFNAQEAYRIEDGEVTVPLRDVSLTGDILTTLTNISALGNRQRMGDPGYCGKGQWVPVCDGGPLVRIEDCLIGGSA
ncbi:MAG TPA: TldD/PmbA family protein [Candidatus Thermoplasmatota archaeon]|nr:TldD/PmbA family protein [Candidatus Thermoplasmatota archaeon]